MFSKIDFLSSQLKTESLKNKNLLFEMVKNRICKLKRKNKNFPLSTGWIRTEENATCSPKKTNK